ncbi:MAG: hypothetical protein AABW61_02785 [Candidatus Aenigmatarchaeota archaeon]|jgi:hypothetical protein
MRKVYIQAGILSLFVFSIGVMIGIWIDNTRLGGIRSALSEADINSYDARLLNSYLQRFGKEYCDIALEQNLAYNDKIYEDGRKIEDKINANIFTPEIEQEWRRYTLLQTQFWLNSVELKEKCGFDYHTVVHVFRQKNTTNAEDINNKVQASILLDLKDKCGKKMMLIPITIDTNLIVVEAVAKQFGISDYPAVIVDESFVFQGVTVKDKLNELLQC